MTTENSTDSNSSSADISSTAPKAIFLIIILLVGIFGNVILVITIGCHRKHLRSALYLFSMNLALLNCVNCFFNIPITLSSTLAGTWNMGNTVCRLNAFFMNLVIIETLLTLTFMALDRMMATKHSDKYGQIQNVPRTIIMIVYSWTHSLSFSIPLLFDTMPVKVYPDINICIISEKTSIVYTCVLILGCFLIPLIVTVVFFIVILKTNCTESSTVQNILTQHQYSKDINEPNLMKEMKGAKFAAILFTMWLIMEVPFVICLLARVLGKSDDLNIDSEMKLAYSWYIDIVFLWIKLGYATVLPILALLLRKELWRNFKDLILCRKSNLIVDMNSNTDESHERIQGNEEKRNVKDDKFKEAFVTNSAFQVPVLFATANGVHIQTFNAEDFSDSEIIYDDEEIHGKKCDVLGSQGNLQTLGDDTSDYDSSYELDPFSVSHPISTKSLKNIDSAIHQRSISQPEVRENKHIKQKKSDLGNLNLTATSAIDSGLDITSGKTVTNTTLKQVLQEIVIKKDKEIKVLENSKDNKTEREIKIPQESAISTSQMCAHSGNITTAAQIENETLAQTKTDDHKTMLSLNKELQTEDDDIIIQNDKNSCHGSQLSLVRHDALSPKTKRKKRKEDKKEKEKRLSSSQDFSNVKRPPRLKPLNRSLHHNSPTYTGENNAQNDSLAESPLHFTRLSDLPCLEYKSDHSNVTEHNRTYKLIQDVSSKTNNDISTNHKTESWVNYPVDVTTPSACNLVDIARDFKQTSGS